MRAGHNGEGAPHPYKHWRTCIRPVGGAVARQFRRTTQPPMTTLTLSIAETSARLNMPRGQVRGMLDRGELPHVVDEHGYRRPLVEAVTRLERRFRGPTISPHDFIQFAGTEHHEPRVREFHEAGARLAGLAQERRELEAARATVLATLDAEAAEMEAAGWPDRAYAAASRASALRASAYLVVGGAVRVVTPPGGAVPGMPLEFTIDDPEDKVPSAPQPLAAPNA